MNNSKEKKDGSSSTVFQTLPKHAQSDLLERRKSILNKSGILNNYEPRFKTTMNAKTAEIPTLQQNKTLLDLSPKCELLMRQISNTRFKLPIFPTDAAISAGRKSPMTEWTSVLSKRDDVGGVFKGITAHFCSKTDEISFLTPPKVGQILVPCLSNTVSVKAQSLAKCEEPPSAKMQAKKLLINFTEKIQILNMHSSIEDLYDIDPYLKDYPHTRHLPDSSFHYRHTPAGQLYVGFANDMLGLIGKLTLSPTKQMACPQQIKPDMITLESKVKFQPIYDLAKSSARKAYKALLKLAPLDESETSFFGSEDRKRHYKINKDKRTSSVKKESARKEILSHERRRNENIGMEPNIEPCYNERKSIAPSTHSSLTLDMPAHVETDTVMEVPATPVEIPITSKTPTVAETQTTLEVKSPKEMDSLSIKRAAQSFVDSVIERDALVRAQEEDALAFWRVFNLIRTVELFAEKILQSKPDVVVRSTEQMLSIKAENSVDITAVADLIATEAYKPYLTQKYIIDQFTRYLLEIAKVKQLEEEYNLEIVTPGEFDALDFKDM